MKRTFFVILLFTFLLSSFPITTSTCVYADINAEKQVTVVVDGVELSEKGHIYKDRTLIPFRAFAEALGAKVQWEQVYREVFIEKGDLMLSTVAGEKVLWVNNVFQTMDVESVIKDNKLQIPARDICDALNVYIEWDAKTYTAKVSTNQTAGIKPWDIESDWLTALSAGEVAWKLHELKQSCESLIEEVDESVLRYHKYLENSKEELNDEDILELKGYDFVVNTIKKAYSEGFESVNTEQLQARADAYIDSFDEGEEPNVELNAFYNELLDIYNKAYICSKVIRVDKLNYKKYFPHTHVHSY